ncbi:hypothetical protein [Streptomyces sp. NPDC089919]|uniref:hypothetical protein n=1 Tax=Streptomyces sp. NPDC089919 TaxID=3155188 RepID=UPI00343EE983
MTMTTAALLTGLALLTAACGPGSDGGDDKKDDSGSNSASSGTSGGKGTTGVDADAALKMRQCLRKQGIDVPDPKPGQDPRGMTLGGNADPQKFQKALEACGSGPKGGGSGPTQQEKDQQLKWVQCMRKNGVNLPDPKFEGGAMRATEIPKGQEEAFKKASEKCA